MRGVSYCQVLTHAAQQATCTGGRVAKQGKEPSASRTAPNHRKPLARYSAMRGALARGLLALHNPRERGTLPADDTSAPLK
jgi:hypothetical protein